MTLDEQIRAMVERYLAAWRSRARHNYGEEYLQERARLEREHGNEAVRLACKNFEVRR